MWSTRAGPTTPSACVLGTSDWETTKIKENIIKKSTLIVSIALATVGLAYAGGGRIELSQLDFGSPPYVISEPGSYVFTENVTESA